MNTKTEENNNTQKPKRAKGHSRKKSNNISKPEDTIHTRSDGNSKSQVRGILFCPKCGSTNVFWASGLPQLWSIWDCRNCGYRGAFILRDSRLAEKIREEYAKRVVGR